MIESISYWEREALKEPYDCVIVGAGFVGLSAAIYLAATKPASRIAVVERGVISYGASTRNAGFACFGTVGELQSDSLTMSIEEIISTVTQRWNGLKNLLSLVEKDAIDYKDNGGTELFENQVSFEKAERRMSFWNNTLKDIVGPDVFRVVDQPHQGFYSKAIYNQYEGQLNPKKAVDCLLEICKDKGIDLFFGTSLESWEKHGELIMLSTSTGVDFCAKKLAFATNAFTRLLIPDLDVQPARNQVLISEEISALDWQGCFHFNNGYIYFRNVGNRILLGGARYLSEDENTYEYGNSEKIQTFLTSFLQNRILDGQQTEIDHWWSGILGVGAEKSPIISNIEDQIYIAVRLGGMGVAIGTSVGKQLAELISND